MLGGRQVIIPPRIPGVANLYGAAIDEANVYLLTEYLPTDTLAKLLEEYDSLTPVSKVCCVVLFSGCGVWCWVVLGFVVLCCRALLTFFFKKKKAENRPWSCWSTKAHPQDRYINNQSDYN